MNENNDRTKNAKPLIFWDKDMIWGVILLAALILKLIMVLTAPDFDYRKTADGIEITGYHGEETEIVIPEKIRGKKVTAIGLCAFKDRSDIESLVIPEGVTKIDELAFCDCTALRNIAIPEGVTIIRYSAFKGCTSLESVDLPDSLREIEMFAFKNCTSLKDIDIPEGVTVIGHEAFFCCESLGSINIPESLEKIDNAAFAGCDFTVYAPYPAEHYGEGVLNRSYITWIVL